MNFELVLDFLFPKRCVSCKKFETYLCSSCWKTITPITQRICPECTRACVNGLVHPGCKGRFTLNGLVAAYRYEGVIRLMVRKFKYAPWLTNLSDTIIHLSLNEIRNDYYFKRFLLNRPTIVPVPLYWIRKLTRGYNQAEILGERLAFALRLPYTNLLKRSKMTKAQFGLKKDEREQNVEHAFTLKEPNKTIPITSVILIDDVWTTGATMCACTKVLKKAGVKEVWALTIAR